MPNTNRSSRSYRSTKAGEASNQIVPYGRGQILEQTGDDMSLALAFPFENNGGKLRTDSFTSSFMSFFSHLKRGTLSFGKIERRGNSGRELAATNQFLALSPVQINEIYKGAQKLNQILGASNSNGLTIDRQSIEFAKELLQGAINLEESLKIIVNQQKKVMTQKKNGIILLEDDDDDGGEEEETKTSEQKQLALPVFSFDKRCKHSQNLQGNQNTSLMKTSYSKGKKLNNKKQDVNTPKLLTRHKRSISDGSNMKSFNAVSKQNNHLDSVHSDSDIRKIPNVIAKLMGLDNLPEEVEGKYTQQKDSKGSEKKMELKSRQTENLLPQKKQKVIEATTMPATRHKELGVDKNLSTRKAKSEAVVDKGLRALKGSDKSIKSDKKNDSTMRVHFIRENRIGVQEKGQRQDHTNNREQKGTGKSRTNDLVLNNMLNRMEQVHGRSEVKSLLQEQQKETNGSIHQSEKRHTNIRESKHVSESSWNSRVKLGLEVWASGRET